MIKSSANIPEKFGLHKRLDAGIGHIVRGCVLKNYPTHASLKKVNIMRIMRRSGGTGIPDEMRDTP